MSGPLTGVRVLDFTQVIAGPMGAQHLADMGADVVKVEPLAGEPWRLTSQFMPGESKAYHVLNRGKRSLALDLQHPAARETVRRLVKTMDVVVINYRPDVAARLGIDYEALSAVKPDLIYVDSTAFGRNGPWANKPGYDIVAQAVSGVLSAAARFDEHGTPVLMMGGLPVLDLATGYAIGMAAVAALYHRALTGEGQLVETSLLQTGLILQHGRFSSLPAADVTGRTRYLEDLQRSREDGEGYQAFVQRQRAQYEAGQVATSTTASTTRATAPLPWATSRPACARSSVRRWALSTTLATTTRTTTPPPRRRWSSGCGSATRWRRSSASSPRHTGATTWTRRASRTGN